MTTNIKCTPEQFAALRAHIGATLEVREWCADLGQRATFNAKENRPYTPEEIASDANGYTGRALLLTIEGA